MWSAAARCGSMAACSIGARSGATATAATFILTTRTGRCCSPLSAVAIHRRVMGLYPNAHTSWRGKRLKLLSSEPLVAGFEGIKLEGIKLEGAKLQGAIPGTVLAIEPGVGLVLASGAGPLLVREAQLEGRSPALGQALIQQLGAGPGDRFGSAAGLLDGANLA